MADVKLKNERFKEILNVVEAALKKADKVAEDKSAWVEANRKLTAFFQAYTRQLESELAMMKRANK